MGAVQPVVQLNSLSAGAQGELLPGSGEPEQERCPAKGGAVEVGYDGVGEIEAPADMAQESRAEGKSEQGTGGNGGNGVGRHRGARTDDSGDVKAGCLLTQLRDSAGRAVVVGGHD